MKPIVPILSLVWLLNACNSQTNQSAKQTGNVANCPESPAVSLEIKIEKEEDFYQVFNYQIHNIIADPDTINFQSLNYDFVFCRGNSSWTVQPGTFKANSPTSENYEDSLAKLADPPYETVELEGKSYQYRVILEPNPFPDFQVEPEKVIFELIAPDRDRPQRQVLYTLEQVKQAQAGIQLGVARITATLTDNNRLFWSIAPEQGEGNGGIATIVSYHPQADEIVVIQPQGMEGQQIMDMAIAGEIPNPTFWLATQMSGEGNPYLPGMGLVAYRPDFQNLASGSLSAYHVRNSPIVGAIPNQLKLEGERLWVGTGNGVCQLQWQGADNPRSWSCWRFALMAQLPREGLPLYSSLFNQTPAATLAPDQTAETVEVLWWSPKNFQTRQGRYEVKFNQGFTVKLDDQGGMPWSEFYQSSNSPSPPSWEPQVYWSGRDWHWRGDRFVRGFDQVPLNFFGGGPSGIGSWQVNRDNRSEQYAIRGDLELLELSKNSTELTSSHR